MLLFFKRNVYRYGEIMAFSLYCLIDEDSGVFSLGLLEKQLSEYFSKTGIFSVEYEEDPFNPLDKHLRFSWEDWWMLIFYETGQNVIDDSRIIANYVDSNQADKISVINKRIIVRFADNDLKAYTNHMVLMIDYLEDIPNSVIFNPNTKEIIKA